MCIFIIQNYLKVPQELHFYNRIKNNYHHAAF